MSMPFYVSPEQQMRDRADYARKNIARGRGSIVLQYDHGIALVAENRHRALHKISEIYDRIAFAAVGRYNEFESLRIAGVRMAELHGYSYDRADVNALMLANRYAQVLGSIFSNAGEKPYEVETVVAEVGASSEEDEIYRLTYDGSVAAEHGFAVMGGAAETLTTYVAERYQPGQSLASALALAVDTLGRDSDEPRVLEPDHLEVAVLDRTRTQKRKFRRLTGPVLERLLTPEPAASTEASTEPTEAAESAPPDTES